jgi:hypothetical protein
MKFGDLYRVLLLLYPADFRRHFSAEMLSVFEQRAGERFANRDSQPVTWLAIEFLSIVKGAHTMWLSRILPIHRNCSSSDAAFPTEASLTVAEVARRRHAAIKDMCTSIAKHDFINARRYSDEEARLKYLLAEMERGVLVGESSPKPTNSTGN